jgi:Sulfotransferase domain
MSLCNVVGPDTHKGCHYILAHQMQMVRVVVILVFFIGKCRLKRNRYGAFECAILTDEGNDAVNRNFPNFSILNTQDKENQFQGEISVKRDQELKGAEPVAATAHERSGVKVIGAGFGRTGTLSLKAALEELGFAPCYHMREVFEHPKDAGLWKAAAEGEPVDWHSVLDQYQAAVDWPVCAFYKELMEEYPEAKVLLTVRDPERWYESTAATIHNVQRRFSKVPRFMKRFLPAISNVGQMIQAVVWDGTFHGNFVNKDQAISIFNRHIEEVQRYVPAERLLVYTVKEGWEPLCAFLGVEVPADKPFPHLNDRENFAVDRVIRRNRMRLSLAGALLIAVGVLAVGFVLLVGRRTKGEG